MKNIFATIILLGSIESIAMTKEILCQTVPGKTNGVFGFTLKNSSFDPNSNLYSIQNPSWTFSYSTARLVCSEDAIDLSGKEVFSCIGYNSAGGKIEISVDLDRGEGSATVHNIGSNIYTHQTEGMTLPCRISKNK